MTAHLHKEIEKLKRKILSISAHVDQAIENAVRALKDRSLKLAQKVIANDGQIDQMEVELEEDCLKVLALYQPVAIDLRYVIAILKINNDLERIADQAVNIAERSAALASVKKIEYPDELTQMLDRTHTMLRKSLKALIELDTGLAREVIEADDEVDNLNRRMFDLSLKRIKKSPQQADSLVTLLSVSRHLERIADQVTNIAEDVIYMVEGKIVRHEKLEENTS
jgi:phosphate transport system protein